MNEMCRKVTNTVDGTVTNEDEKKVTSGGSQKPADSSNQYAADNPSAGVRSDLQNGYDIDLAQNQVGLWQNQQMIYQHMMNLDEKYNRIMINGMRKNHRKMVDTVLISNENDEMVIVKKFDDGSIDLLPLFVHSQGSLEITTITIMDGKYVLAGIKVGKSGFAVVLPVVEIKADNVYKALARKGIKFNPRINQTWAGKALCDYVLYKVSAGTRMTNLSGLAGWENDKFICADTMHYLDEYKYKMKLPVFQKHFDKDAANPARIPD